MSDSTAPEATPAEGGATDPKAKPKAPAKGAPVWILAVVGALGAGTALGIFVVGPMAGNMRAQAAAHAGESKKSDKDASARKPIYKLDNLIVNPAGTRGSHFLMTSISIEVPDDKLESRLHDHDAMVRDAIIGALDTQTLETLSMPTGRDTVRAAIARSIAPIVGPNAHLPIYLTQFVIQ